MNTQEERKERMEAALRMLAGQSAIGPGQTLLSAWAGSLNTLRVLPSADKGGEFSYARRPEDIENDARRVRTTLPRIARRQWAIAADYIPDDALDVASRTLVNFIWPDLSGVRVLRGADVLGVYRGYTGISCMKGAAADYCKIYADNPDRVEILAIPGAATGTWHAKALVWVDEKFRFVLDRVYGSAQDTIAIVEFAKAHYPDIYINETGRYNQSLPGSSCLYTGHVCLNYRGAMPLPYLDSFYNATLTTREGETALRLSTQATRETSAMHSQDGGGIAECGHCGALFLDPENKGACEDCGGMKCSNCGGIIPNDREYTHNDDIYCESCYYEAFSPCVACGGSFDRDDVTYVDGRGDYCEECLDTRFFHCAGCGEYIPLVGRNAQSAIEGADGNNYCADCWCERFSACEECGTVVNSDDAIQVDGDSYCTDCAKECSTCGEYAKANDLDAEGRCEDCRSEQVEEDMKPAPFAEVKPESEVASCA